MSVIEAGATSSVIGRRETDGDVFVGGTWAAGSRGVFVVDDPATGTEVARVSDGGVDDATAAVDAAEDALVVWQALAPRARSVILYRAFESMISHRDELADLICLENGKSRTDALGEVTYAAEFLRWFSEEAVRAGGDYGPAPAGGAKTLVTHRPIGIAALVTPWNFPAAMATRKIAPALAAGCTVVLKPAAETPLTAIALCRLLAEAGVPDGVVNLVPTTDAGAVVSAWLSDRRVRLISFTGSTAVGRILLRQAADRVVVTAMELGGNAPFVVTADADLDAAVAGTMVAKFRGGGQACTAANRFFVHSTVAAEFTEKLCAAVRSLKVGPAADESSAIGPLISAKAVVGVTAVVERAVDQGARIAFRSSVGGLDGHFYPPTVLADVPADADILDTEIFGPVAPITTYDDDAELIQRVNRSEMGLAAYVYAGDLAHAIRLGEAIEAGMIGINRGLVSDPSAPFGGMKQSGLGREGARVGLEEFTETQYLSFDWPH